MIFSMAKISQYVMSIDQGTTGTTVNLINDRGQSVVRASNEFRQIFPKPGWVEHNPNDILKSVYAQIKVALKKVRANQVAAIGITNQRETVVAWDRRTGKALYNAIVWQDRRTASFCDGLKAQGFEQQIRDKSGLVIDPYFSASKMHWLLQNVERVRQVADKGNLCFGTIDSFLLWNLTDGASFQTDVSNASRTQLMNLQTGEWDDELLKIFSIQRSSLAQISPSNSVFGTTRGVTGLPDGVPISGIAGDQQAALFGQACFKTGESKCTFGTGSFLLINSGNKQIKSSSGLLTTAAWKLKDDSEITYALEGGAFVCGAAVQFLRDQLGFIKTSADVEKLARSVKSSGGVEFVPALTGLGAPYWDPEARGLIAGLTRGSGRGEIARATLEAMALQNAEILFAMQKDLGADLQSVRVDGGASVNSLLMQIQADYLGVEVVRPKMIETTSAGAAYLAGLGIGMWRDTKEIEKIWRADKTFLPRIPSTERAERLVRWQAAVRRALSVHQ
jgi:glycerol kinase